MIPIPKQIRPLPLKTTDINLWIDGVVTALDEGRLGVEALTGATNMILDQDATLRPRPSMQLYGPQPTGTVLGKPFQFSVNVGLTITHYMIVVQVIDGVANAYIATPEASEWTACGGDVELATTGTYKYIQIANYVLVLNSANPLTWLDLTTVPGDNTLNQMDAIADPTTAPTLAQTGASGDDYEIWYGVTYNSSVGQTAGSPIASLTTSVPRSGFTPGSIYITVTPATLPDDIDSWNLYCGITQSGVGAPTMFLIAAGINPSQTTYIDNGTASQIINQTMPIVNSTVGPYAGTGANIGGTLFLLQDANNPYMLDIGGNVGFELDFSPANGGDQLPIGPGSGQLPTVVWNFRSGPGDPEIKVMTDDAGGKGKRWTISQSTVNYDGTEIEVWGATEDYGFNGTGAGGSLISWNNNTYYLGSDAFYTTGTEPQLQNLLNTKSVSQTMSPLNDFASLNQGAFGQVDGSVFYQRLYWCVPVDSPTNNQIWVLDLQRGGAWIKPWNIACQGITVIQDNEAETHQLFLIGNGIYQSTYEQMTKDDTSGVFPTGWNTGVIGFSGDLRVWSNVEKIVIVILRGQGIINFTVTGWTLNSVATGQIEVVGSKQFENTPALSGYGWNQGGYNLSPMLKWNDFFDLASTTIALTQDVDIPIGQQLRYFLVQASTDTAGVDYNLSNIIPLYVVVGVKNLT